jgi:lysophospholipase L1-like esterase
MTSLPIDTKSRYRVAPQMKHYDQHGVVWVPFMMYFHQPNYSSEALNTDPQGFRHTFKNQHALIDKTDIKSDPVNLLVGSSTVFGVGASHDSKTIPSLLNLKSNDLWLNFGIRGFTSTQEFILFMTHHHQFKKIRRIIVMSGINDLVIYMMSSQFNKKMGSFFWASQFNQAMKTPMSFSHKVIRRFLRAGLRPFYGNEIDYEKVSLRKTLAMLQKKITLADLKKSIPKPLTKPILDHEGEKEDLINPLERNLKNWKVFSDQLGFELTYVLQPFANWLPERILSDEEKVLFKILDNAPDNPWHIHAKRMGFDKHEWFKSRLQGICDIERIDFYDMNEYLSDSRFNNKWLFVDRIHLTDEGNQICADFLEKEVLK